MWHKGDRGRERERSKGCGIMEREGERDLKVVA